MTAKTPLILLPGLLCDEALWAHQVQTLTDIADVTVADMTLDDTVEDMAERVLKAAPERFALAGLSMGGYAALAIIRRAPERGRTVPRALDGPRARASCPPARIPATQISGAWSVSTRSRRRSNPAAPGRSYSAIS